MACTSGCHAAGALPGARAQGEGGAAAEVAAEAAGIGDALDRALEAWELRRLLGGPYDDRGAVLTIQVRGALRSRRVGVQAR